jgi:hypothetical protein
MDGSLEFVCSLLSWTSEVAAIRQNAIIFLDFAEALGAGRIS